MAVQAQSCSQGNKNFPHPSFIEMQGTIKHHYETHQALNCWYWTVTADRVQWWVTNSKYTAFIWCFSSQFALPYKSAVTQTSIHWWQWLYCTDCSSETVTIHTHPLRQQWPSIRKNWGFNNLLKDTSKYRLQELRIKPQMQDFKPRNQALHSVT